LNAAPGDAAAKERGGEIEQVQEWDKNCDQNINPGLRHDFRTGGRDGFGDPDYPQGAAKGREEQGKNEERDDL